MLMKVRTIPANREISALITLFFHSSSGDEFHNIFVEG